MRTKDNLYFSLSILQKLFMKKLLLQHKHRHILSAIVLQLFVLFAVAQVRISGKVTNPEGTGIANISVAVKNTNLGTVTDASGNYDLSANLKPGNYMVEFTGIGLKSSEQQLRVTNENAYSINTFLAIDALGLDEVIVTGTLGRTSKRQIGNSISTINSSQLQNTGSQNLSSILNGRVMGAQVNQNSGDPGGGTSVKLRGVGSIFGSSEPLYIVDGVIIDNSSANVINLSADAQGARIQGGTNRLVDINPNDIERIEVINGAAAAAIYGSRASNGVVQIFTKKGKSGKPQVSFTTSVQHNFLRKRLEFNDYPFRFGYPGENKLGYAQDRLTIVGNNRPATTTAANDRKEPTQYTLAAFPATGPIALFGNPLDLNKYPVTRYDYQDNIFENSLGTDNHVSVTGGNENANYYFSGSYLKNNGIIKNTNFQRYGFRARTDFTLSSWVKLSGGVLFTNSRSKDMPNGNNFFSPVSTVTIIDNVWDVTERDVFGNLQHTEPVRLNPLSVIETFDIRQEINRTLSDVKVTLTPLSGFISLPSWAL